MKIAIIDYLVTATNPAGSCHRALITALAPEHEFTVFSAQFENPLPKAVAWVRVPSIRRPLAALFLSFHFSAPFKFWRSRRQGAGFAVVQSVESNFWLSDIVYSHFCHRRFLRHSWAHTHQTGLRGAFRWLDHWLHAALEPCTLRRARWVVVPSQGLARELCEEYPFVAAKLRVIPNPVDLVSFERPPLFDRAAIRTRLGIETDDTMIVFVALGQFDRKGLPFLLHALSRRPRAAWKLVVVGGTPDLIRSYTGKTKALGIEDSVRWAGHQEDVRPYLWASDLFALPSLYEVFPLALLQAAAASCPLLISKLNGAEEFAEDGENCVMVRPDTEGVLEGLDRFKRLSVAERLCLGRAARDSVSPYSVDKFSSAWGQFYREIEGAAAQ